jgi:hypothetical protein
MFAQMCGLCYSINTRYSADEMHKLRPHRYLSHTHPDDKSGETCQALEWRCNKKPNGKASWIFVVVEAVE